MGGSTWTVPTAPAPLTDLLQLICTGPIAWARAGAPSHSASRATSEESTSLRILIVDRNAGDVARRCRNSCCSTPRLVEPVDHDTSIHRAARTGPSHREGELEEPRHWLARDLPRHVHVGEVRALHEVGKDHSCRARPHWRECAGSVGSGRAFRRPLEGAGKAGQPGEGGGDDDQEFEHWIVANADVPRAATAQWTTRIGGQQGLRRARVVDTEVDDVRRVARSRGRVNDGPSGNVASEGEESVKDHVRPPLLPC